MNLELTNRRALVMGGTKGLGRSIADALAEEGAALTISGRDQGKLDEAATALRAKGAASAINIVADVASGEAISIAFRSETQQVSVSADRSAYAG